MEDFIESVAKRAKSGAWPKGDSCVRPNDAPRPEARTSELDERRNDQDSTPTADRVDLVVVTAVPDEKAQALRAFTPVDGWVHDVRNGVCFDVADIQLAKAQIRVAIAVQNSMGMVPAAILTMKSLQSWKPRMLAMTGVCAGVKGRVEIGDIITAKQVFDYGSGKLAGGQLVPDYEAIPLDDDLCSYAEALGSDTEWLRALKAEWQAGAPSTELNAHVGPIASGAAVVADDATVEGIQKHKRSLAGIDMESYGVARAVLSMLQPRVPFVVVKGVQDFADDFKNDAQRNYAAYVSARFLRELIHRYWDVLDRRSGLL